MSRPWRDITWPDWGVPAGVLVLLAAETLSVQPPHLLAVLAIQATACLALVWRRRFTIVSCLVSGWLATVGPFLGAEMQDLSAPILLIAVICYSLARWLRDYRGLLVIAAMLLGITGDYLFTDSRDNNVSAASSTRTPAGTPQSGHVMSRHGLLTHRG